MEHILHQSSVNGFFFQDDRTRAAADYAKCETSFASIIEAESRELVGYLALIP
jgi:hypothetical protein